MAIDLARVCNASEAALQGASLAELRERCVSLGDAFGVAGAEWALVAGAPLVAFFAVMIHRGIQNNNDVADGKPKRWSTAQIWWRALSAAVYSLLGAYAAATFGQFALELVPPWFVACAAWGLALLGGIGLMIAGWISGGGTIAMKIVGTLVFVVLAALLTLSGFGAWSVATDAPAAFASYAGFLTWGTLVIGGVGGFVGFVAGDNDAYHPAAGWILVPWFATWGLLGSMLAVFMHLGAWMFGKDHGDFWRDYEWTFFHTYKEGLRLVPKFGFSQGDALSADNEFHVWHEATHVVQHMIFGPLYPLSYLVWTVVGGVIGFIIGLFRLKPLQGAYGFGYINNPWELWEYVAPINSKHGVHTRSGFLVFSDTVAWVVGVVYFVLVVALFVWWVVVKIA